MQTPTRILLIDDDASHRASVHAALVATGLNFSLDEAADADSGRAAARSETFDCILLSCGGSDLLAKLVSPEGGRQAVIVLGDGADDATALLRAGALDYVGRADFEALARAIERAEGRRAFVSAMRAARDDAEAKARELDALNRQKALILSILAHDLRNPLQVLLGMSELLGDAARAGDMKAVVRRAEAVHEASEQAHMLIDSLFGWASLYMDARAVEPVRVSLGKLFSDCAVGLQEAADKKSIAIEYEAAGLHVLAQEDIAAAVLRNLVGNAVKFTLAAGRVTIGAATRGGKVVVSVSDTGVGMTDAQIAGLFQRERRSTSAGTAGERGAGLGLLLSRDLCDWIGGEIEVESRVGEGATFRVLLPAGD